MSRARARRADPLTALESATTKRQEAIWEEARTAGLDDNTINRVYAQGEQQQSGAGYRAIESETDRALQRVAEERDGVRASPCRGRRRSGLEQNAQRESTDALKALGSATKKRQDGNLGRRRGSPASTTTPSATVF